MLKINGQEISGVMATDGKFKSAFCNQPYAARKFGTAVTFPQFKINGQPAQFAAPGTRPTFTLRKTLTLSDLTSEGVYWVLNTDTDPIILQKLSNGLPTGDTIEIGPRPAVSGQVWVVVEIIGGGGGGSGGGAALNGVGGGAGAYGLFATSYFAIRWKGADYKGDNVQETLSSSGETYLRGNGAGSSNRGEAHAGAVVIIGDTTGSSGAMYENDGIYITGGEGGDGGTPGSGGRVIVNYNDNNTSPMERGRLVVLYTSNGSNGYAGLSGTHTFEDITLSCGLEGETVCEKTYGPYSVESNEAGAGGNSFFGAGGAPGNGYGDDGESPAATAYGAGGGGGRMKPFGSTTGGNGSGAVINIYY